MNVFFNKCFVIFALLSFFITFSAHSSGDSKLNNNPLLRELPAISFAPLVKKVAPAVVNIYATRMINSSPLPPIFSDPTFKHFFGDGAPFGGGIGQVQSSLGSGVIVRASGVVVTNYHVIKHAEEVKVVLQDGRQLEAEIVVRDKRTDIAILKIKDAPKDMPYLEFRDVDSLEVGDIVFAFGNPFGFDHTVTSGIVSAKARNQVGVADFRSLIQTDAAINPGNSGGPLVSVDGRIVGINTAIFSNNGGSVGIGFAIPSNLVLPVLNSIDHGGEIKRAWLGMSVDSITYDMAQALALEKPGGVIVRKIIKGGPAEDAKLTVGDIILRMGEHNISNEADYRFRIATMPLNSKISLSILRNGVPSSVQITLKEAPSDFKSKRVQITGRNPLSGSIVIDLSPAVASELGFEGDEGGIVILAIKPGSPAAYTGILPGDIIKKINGIEIVKAIEMSKYLSRSFGGWAIEFERGGRKHVINIRNW
jgi:Do/DeqQ family serine protease